MFCSERTQPTAKKNHRCTWCGQHILAGTKYNKWSSVDDGWFMNKMHDECYDAMHEEFRLSWDNEYTPYDNERPVVNTEEVSCDVYTS